MRRPHGIGAPALRRAAAGASALALLLVGCTRPPTRPPTGPKPTRFTDAARQAQASTPDKVPWFCNAAGFGTPSSGHGNGSHVDPAYAGKTKGPLDRATCHQLAAQLDQTLGAVRGLETRGKGEAAGLVGFGGYLPGLGTHHGRYADLVDQTYNPNAVQTFDPAKPTFLIYGGRAANSPLVGAAWRVAGNVPRPPEGFAGDNDWYHKHSHLCSAPGLAPAEEVSPEECRAMGGTSFTIPGGGDYLLHLWLIEPYEYRNDLFVSGHPCLLANGVAPSTDACWQTAHRDPALGPPPGTGGGHDDGHGH